MTKWTVEYTHGFIFIKLIFRQCCHYKITVLRILKSDFESCKGSTWNIWNSNIIFLPDYIISLLKEEEGFFPCKTISYSTFSCSASYPARMNRECSSQSHVTWTLKEISVFMNQRISEASKDTKKQKYEGRNAILSRHKPLLTQNLNLGLQSFQLITYIWYVH